MVKMIQRVRAAVMAIFGDDSQELEMVGGKRSSQRKRRARASKAPVAVIAPVAKAA